jgi:predicted AAA+ superfamily ATPase
MEGSFLLAEVKNFSWSLKQQSKAKKKCYCADNGLVSSVAFAQSENRGRLFENLVFSELLKAGAGDVFFFSERKECDFILRRGTGLVGVQVCFDLNGVNRGRELGGLHAAMEKYGLERGYLVTPDVEVRLSDRVAIIPFWKMHLEEMMRP